MGVEQKDKCNRPQRLCLSWFLCSTRTPPLRLYFYVRRNPSLLFLPTSKHRRPSTATQTTKISAASQQRPNTAAADTERRRPLRTTQNPRKRTAVVVEATRRNVGMFRVLLRAAATTNTRYAGVAQLAPSPARQNTLDHPSESGASSS